MLFNEVLENGTEVFILSKELFGFILSNNNLSYSVAIDNSEHIVVDFEDVVKVLPIGVEVKIKDTAFYGIVLGDDRDLPLENIEGFNYWIGEDINSDNKLLVHYEDVCLA